MTAAIRIENVSKRFGAFVALHGVSFEIPKGSVFGLLGPNGAGKTTLMSVVSGFLKPSAGHVDVLGINIENISELKGRLSILPQDAQLMANVPLIEQLIFFSQLSGRNRVEAEKEAMHALGLVGLSGRAKDDARVLSHGMTKRIGIAQAFLGNPEVVMLDEPTAGLDPKSAASVREVIDDLRKSATVIVSSHNLPDIQKMCDRVAILDHGRLMACNTVAEITQAGRVLRMTFARPLSDAEIAAIKQVAAVTGVGPDPAPPGVFLYAIQIDPAKAPPASDDAGGQDQLVTEIVQRLVPTGAIPRSIEEGVALEQKFLDITRQADQLHGQRPPM